MTAFNLDFDDLLLGNVYKLSGTPAESQYHGCGKAWAAVNNGQILAIRYMGDFDFDRSQLPAWAAAALSAYGALAAPLWPVDHISSPDLGRIKKAAIAAGHPEFGPRGGQIKASKIARAARELIRNAEREQFGQYRADCRAELAKLGTVVSGMCSCYEFQELNNQPTPNLEKQT